MYSSPFNVNTNHNIVNLLKNRENKLETAKSLQQNCQFTAPLLKRFGLEYELEGHQGCVNCLEWSSNGRILASGSDDTHVRIWDPFRHKNLSIVPTRHIGNIFSVKFLGDESLIATGAGDCRVIVQSVEDSKSQSPLIDCNCHLGRIKRLAKAPDQPLLFWSASEDGLVIQYDIREPHECMVQSQVFLDLSYTSELKCIAVNPTRPHLVAVGANDCYVRLYDRRMVRISKYRSSHTFESRKRLPAEPQDPNCVQYFAPGHLAKDNGGEFSHKLAATYVTFNSAGNEMLVNMGGEHIYLFDINNARYINELRMPENLSKKDKTPMLHNVSSEISVNNKLPMCTHSYKLSKSNCACKYTDRASRLYQRKWIGDIYSAARDYLYVIQQWPDNEKAFLSFIDCLVQLKWVTEATNWLELFHKLFPNQDCKQLKKLQEAIFNLKVGGNTENINIDAYGENCVTDEEKNWRLDSRDYELRFIGHCNTTTDIKEANFLGEEGNFICAGSDDGLIFIWDRKTTNVLTALSGDFSIVNCVQPHPSACFLASSGIDPVVKLWSPIKEDGSINLHEVSNPFVAIEANQERMAMDPFETMLANMGYRVRHHTVTDSTQLSPTQMCRTS